MIKQTGRLVGACRFVLAGDGLTLTLQRALVHILAVTIWLSRMTCHFYVLDFRTEIVTLA